MGFRSRAALGTAAIILALPAVASAATTTVDPAAGACARGASCPTIQGAVDASMAGDAISIKAGVYTGDITVPKDTLSISAETGTQLTGSIAATGKDFHLAGLLLLRGAGSGAALTASSGVQVTGSVIISAVGPGVSMTGGEANAIQGSTIGTAAPASDAITQSTSQAGAHALAIDSSVILGGADGAGVRVTTTGQSGAVDVKLRHVTLPLLAKNAVVLDSTAATGTPGVPTAKPTGSITATIQSSILHSKAGSTAANFIPALLGSPIPDTPALAANAITVTQTKSDANTFTPIPAQGRGPQITEGTPTLTSDFQLLDPTYHLIVGSPAIDAGGALGDGEYAKDIDGDPRVAGAQSDIGADEFVDHPPVAKTISATPTSPKSGQEVTFSIDAADQDTGDVLGYGFNFGDGTNTSGTTSSVTHTFAKPGSYKVDGIVVDKANGFSAIVSTTVNVVDGTAPEVHIGSYKLSGFRSGLSVSGSVLDTSGVKSVELAITRLAGCRQFNGKTFAKSGGCAKYTFVPATVTGNIWNFSAPGKLKLPKGKYQMRVRATDTGANTSVGFRAKSKTLVAFKVK